MQEQQNIAYKQSWRDEHPKWVCGLANAQGGKLFIGVDDREMVVGLDEYKKLMDDIPNKVVNHLGLVVDVNLLQSENKRYIEINVPVSSIGIKSWRISEVYKDFLRANGDTADPYLQHPDGSIWESADDYLIRPWC
ncbi:putative DNA-binding protein [Chitinophaga polysaccharea]|uniref:Putative DNA-binding protein n=1 Tax=Chitinophaga polysaccharea TaxID=1293035 RepID=A0A561PRG0_9BACT|nr:ATP-binding protein [Chitinophaga polysaccharea]TWF40705.1 putative DNA-binding protein [Chitinophaga polysaccharea]